MGQQLSVYVSDSMKKELEELSAKRGRSISFIVNTALSKTYGLKYDKQTRQGEKNNK